MTSKNSAKSVWETLSEIDVTSHIEMKGKFAYVSWAWAWALVKQNYPTATFEKLTFVDNQNNILPFMRDSWLWYKRICWRRLTSYGRKL